MARWTFQVPIPPFLTRRPAPAPPVVVAPAPKTPHRIADYAPNRDAARVRRASIRAATAIMNDTVATEMPVEGTPLEQQIIDGLDAAAIVFLDILKDDSKDKDGNLRVDAKTRMDAFKMLADWTVKRKKSAPEDSGGIPPYEKIRKWLDEQGFAIVPKKKAGRPSAEDLAKRALVLGEPAKLPEDPPLKPVGDEQLADRLKRLAESRPDAKESVRGA